MPKLGTVVFNGASGTQYPFNYYPVTEECPKESGIYIFGKLDGNMITPIYIGKAASFEARFFNHHKDDCIDKNGANTICLMQVTDENKRTVIEKDLLKQHATKCNEINNPVTPR